MDAIFAREWITQTIAHVILKRNVEFMIYSNQQRIAQVFIECDEPEDCDKFYCMEIVITVDGNTDIFYYYTNDFIFQEDPNRKIDKEITQEYINDAYLNRNDMNDVCCDILANHFAKLKQNYIDWNVKMMLLSFMYEFYCMMDVEEKQKITDWKNVEMVLMDEYMLSFVSKY
jgi:hypothetical protein